MGNELPACSRGLLRTVAVSFVCLFGALGGLRAEEGARGVTLEPVRLGSATFPAGTLVEVTESQADRLRIRAGGSAEAWVAKKFVRVDPDPDDTSLLSRFSGAVADLHWREYVPSEVTELVDTVATNLPARAAPVDLAALLPDDQRPETVVRPGEFVFLALPFTQQGRGGICAGASLLNIVDFLGMPFQLSQYEFFQLFDAGRSGATISQMDQGLKNVGYEFTPLLLEEKLKRKDARKIERRCMDILDSGQPLSVCVPGHALTLVGYNMKTESFYAWDQARTGRDPRVSEAVANLPGGIYEIPMGQLGLELDTIGHVTKLETPFDGQREKEQVLEISGLPADTDLLKHKIWAPDRARDRDVRDFYQDVLPVLINGLMRKGRTVIVPTGKEIPGRPDWRRGELIRIVGKSGNDYRVLMCPGETETAVSLRDLSRFVFDNDGIYFSHGAK
jgi:hypothetical protein